MRATSKRKHLRLLRGEPDPPFVPPSVFIAGSAFVIVGLTVLFALGY